MLSHAPTLVKPYHDLSAALLAPMELDPRLQELVVLRVAHLLDARYVWEQHVALARSAGLTWLQIGAVRMPAIVESCFTLKERIVLQVVGAIVRTGRPSDDLFEQARVLCSPREMVELLMLVGCNVAVGRLVTTLDIEPEPALIERTLEILGDEPVLSFAAED